MRKSKKNNIIRNVKAARGLDRAAHFANGGTLLEWMGGPRLVTADRKKKASKKACRGRVNW